eukprot:gene928-1010_t
MEGWLLKKKSNSLFKGENHRWFRIQEVKGSDQAELALCYYYSQRDKEAKGWIYLKDIIQLVDEVKTFSVVSAARTLVLEAKTTGEHTLWLQTLSTLCPQADSSTVRAISSWSQSKTELGKENDSRSGWPQSKGEQPAKEDYYTLSADQLRRRESKPAPLDRSASLFSRHAQGENNSFYLGQGDASALPHSNSSASDADAPSKARNDRPPPHDKTRRRPSRQRRQEADGEEGEEDIEHPVQEEAEGEESQRQRREPSRHRRPSNGRSANRGPRKDSENRRDVERNVGDTVSQRLQRHLRSEGDPFGPAEELHAVNRAKEKIRSKRQHAAHGRSDDSSSDHRSDMDGDEEEQDERMRHEEEDSDSDYGGRTSQYDHHADFEIERPTNRRSDADVKQSGFHDEEDEATNKGPSRRSMGDFLSRRAERKTSADSEDDEPAEEKPVPRKPPRPPQSQPPPYVIPTTNRQNLGLGLSTPPRPAGNPGTQIDANFATDDWDAEEAKPQQQQQQSSSQEGGDGRSMLVASNLRADPNWLDEDFDS